MTMNDFSAKKYLRRYIGDRGRQQTKRDLPMILSKHPESRNSLIAAAIDLRLGYIELPEGNLSEQPAVPKTENLEKVLYFFDLAELVGISNHEITNLLRRGASEDEIMNKLNASLHQQTRYEEAPF